MSHCIAIWNGLISNIPTGWVLCDGNNGSPNLANKFVRGAYSKTTRPAGTTGGGGAHGHTIGSGGGAHSHYLNYAGSHQHSYSAGSDLGAGANYDMHGAEHSHPSPYGGSTHSHDNAAGTTEASPPFYTLAYIMATSGGVVPNSPQNTIILWTGSEDDVPDGWGICDGQSGRPDLRDKFLLGYKSGTNNVGDTGGSDAHSHSLVDDGEHGHTSDSDSQSFSHTHTATSGGYLADGDYALSTEGPSHSHDGLGNAGGHNHDIGNGSTLPAYYTLAYIVKL